MEKNERDTHYINLRHNNIILGIIGMLLFWGITIFYIFTDYQSFKYRGTEKLRELTSSAIARTENLISDLHITMKLLDEWIQNNPETDPRTDVEFNNLINVFREHTNKNIDIRIADENGGLFYFPTKSMTPLANVSDREYFIIQKNQNLPAKSLYFSEPVLSRVTAKWGTPISYKLQKNKHKLFILFAVIEFNAYDEMYKDLVKNSKRAVSVIREDKMVLVRTPYDKYLIGKKSNVDNNIVENRNKMQVITVYNPHKNRRIVLFDKLENQSIYILIADDYEKDIRLWIVSIFKKLAAASIVVILFLILNIRSIKLLKKLNETKKQLEVAARFDYLTSLKNRSYFFERVIDEMERAKRTKSPMVLLVLDVDKFKFVNDTYGHPEGDVVLKKIADILTTGTRSSDIVGRVGGEEFAILLTETDLNIGKDVAERIRIEAHKVKLGEWTGGVSIGVAEWKNGLETLEQLYKRADNSLCEAKRNGRNRIIVNKE